MRSLLVVVIGALVSVAGCSSSGGADQGGEPPGGDSGAADGSSPGDASTTDGARPIVDASTDAAPGADGSGTTDGATRDAGAGSDGDLPPALGPVEDGGLLVQFVTSDQTVAFDESQQEMSTGTITFGVSNAAASDGIVADLARTGGQATLGTGGAEEVVSQRSFSFGTFRYRASLAQCASTEEAVNGLFTYFNDGSLAPDGLVINREVDIEILCGEPYLINLTIWTEYTDDSHLENQSRVLDTRTGTLYVYANDSEGNQTGTENHPELVIPGFPQAGAFYEMGFTWAPDHLTYYLWNGATPLTLWNATDTARIPQAAMPQHFNIWAPGEHWSTGDMAGPPAHDATLVMDWFRYDPL
jgi:hypothetical protein